MTLLLYAVGGTAVPAGRGLHDAPLRTIEAHGLSAIVSDWSDGSPMASNDALWDYEQVIERLMARQVILPARFGSLLDDEQSVRRLLDERQAALSAGLERVRGAVEFGITVAWGVAARVPVPTDSGKAYLLGQLALRRDAEAIAQGLGPLAELARASRQRLLSRPALPLTAAYLVDRERAEEFLELTAELDAELGDVELVCTGPWPPFSFVEELPQ